MKRKNRINEIPHRAFALYLLFSLLGMLSMLGGIMVVQHLAQQRHAQLARKNAFTTQKSKIAIALQENDVSRLQQLCQRFSFSSGIDWCGVYSADGICIANTDQARIGKDREFHAGEVKIDSDIEIVEIKDPAINGMEFSSELGAKRHTGTYAVMFSRGSSWFAASGFGPLFSFVFLVPLALILVGGICLRKQLKPLGSIHAQLVDFAARPSLSMAQFEKVESAAAVSLGWNALVNELGDPQQRPELKERLLGVANSSRSDRHENAVNSLPDGIAETNIDGQITFINNAMAAILGEDEKEKLIGEDLVARLEAEGKNGLDGIFDDRSSSRQVIAELKKNTEFGDRVLRVGKHPIAPGSNDPTAGQAWCIRDVTQQKLAEKAREEFLNSATHELRTPLANIKAYAETLSLSDLSDVEQQKEFCNIINTEATRLARFIDELLDVSSIEAGSLHANLQRVEVDRLLGDVVAKVEPLMIQKNIEMETLFSEKLPELALDKEKISTSLVNLLGNAAKYTPAGGHVAFKAQVKRDQLFISVTDNGIGISQADLPRIFDKFFRSDDDRVHEEAGTGLGLAFVNEVAKLHGAKLHVESRLEEGTTFTLQMAIPKEVQHV